MIEKVIKDKEKLSQELIKARGEHENGMREITRTLSISECSIDEIKKNIQKLKV